MVGNRLKSLFSLNSHGHPKDSLAWTQTLTKVPGWQSMFKQGEGAVAYLDIILTRNFVTFPINVTCDFMTFPIN